MGATGACWRRSSLAVRDCDANDDGHRGRSPEPGTPSFTLKRLRPCRGPRRQRQQQERARHAELTRKTLPRVHRRDDLGPRGDGRRQGLEFYKQAPPSATSPEGGATKTADGLDGHTTVSYRTWRWNPRHLHQPRRRLLQGRRGASKVKQAMIGRFAGGARPQARRHGGRRTSSTHQARPECRRRILRVDQPDALTRMMLLFQPHLAPT